MLKVFQRYKYLLFIAVLAFVIPFITQASRKVKSTSQTTEPTPYPTISTTPLLTPSPIVLASPTPKVLSKKLYKIAAIGDSMVETIGGNLDYLYKELKKKYPDTDFYMYNYGISSENVIEGLARFDKPFAHADRSYLPISEVKPDVIIIGSYAYNPPQGDTTTLHFNALSEMIKKAKAITPNVYVQAEIAPLEKDFGKGPGGVNWPPELVGPHVEKILKLLGNARSLPGALGVRLIDVYPKTTLPGSAYGQPKFVDSNDNIHPSILGHTFIAQTAVSTIVLQ